MDWIDVRKARPVVNQKVLVYCKTFSWMEEMLVGYYNGGWWDVEGGHIVPSYWMSLPEPPICEE